MRRFLIIIFLIQTSVCFAQYQSRGVEYNYDDAEGFLADGNYYDALPLYETLFASYPKVLEYQLKIGVCHIGLTTYPEKAIKNIEAVIAKKKNTPNAYFFLAKAYALNYEFNKAIEFFNKAKEHKKTSTENKKLIPLLIQQCENAKKLIATPLNVEIVNLGKPINTEDNEYGPTINADETSLIYTYRGKKSTGGRQDFFNNPVDNGNFYEDVYISKKIDEKWSKPTSIHDSINTDRHEASISQSSDGQKLFVYRDTKENSGDIFITKNDSDGWGKLEPVNVNSAYWEGSASVSPNGRFLFFTSDKPGGLGGRDIYMAELQNDNTWGEVKNLGPTINTPYNDDAPFISADNTTFYFSSEGHSSMGGYDIFESKILNDSTFQTPINIGYPINTTANDVFFFVSGKGNAYYSSAKKGGYGQYDLYVINVKDIINHENVALVKGYVKTNNNPIRATIEVKSELNNKTSTYYSDAQTGNYSFYLNANDYFVITYKVKGYVSKIETIDTKGLTSYKEYIKNINLYNDSNRIDIIGAALIEEEPETPIINARINLFNANKTISLTDTTDQSGNYNFDNLPQDDYYLMFLNEEDEKLIEDSTYLFKGHIKLNGLPYSDVTINNVTSDDEGFYKIEMKNKHLFSQLNNDANGLGELDYEDPGLFTKLLDKYGDKEVEGLIYKVQVGAYNNPENFSYKHLISINEVEKTILDDGITRFTMGSLSTLRAANTLKNKVVAKGQTDAFIILFINGKRTYLNEVIEQGLFD